MAQQVLWDDHTVDEIADNIVNKERPYYSILFMKKLLTALGKEKTKEILTEMNTTGGANHDGFAASVYIIEQIKD